MADWAKMRKVWTEARDKHGVKKGAVSGVSIGDAIEKVEKAQSKSYGDVIAATKALDDALDKYRAKLGKTNPAFVTWIGKTIEKDAKALSDEAKLDLASLKWIDDNVFRETLASTANLFPDIGKARLAHAMTVRKDNPVSWADACKAQGLFAGVEKVAAIVAKRLTTMKAMKWNLALSGRDKEYAALVTFAEACLDDVKFCILWSKSADFDAFSNFSRTSQGRSTYLAVKEPAVKALEKLMG